MNVVTIKLQIPYDTIYQKCYIWSIYQWNKWLVELLNYFINTKDDRFKWFVSRRYLSNLWILLHSMIIPKEDGFHPYDHAPIKLMTWEESVSTKTRRTPRTLKARRPSRRPISSACKGPEEAHFPLLIRKKIQTFNPILFSSER